VDAFDQVAAGLEHRGAPRQARAGQAVTGQAEEWQGEALHEAVEYAKAYDGQFEFMLAMKAKVLADRPLSKNMVFAILRTKEHDLRVAAMRKVETGAKVDVGGSPGVDLSGLPKGRTRYAVENASGELTFIQIDNLQGEQGKWGGWIFVRQQLSDWTERRGSQRPGSLYKGVWASLLEKVLAAPREAMQRYGDELGICARCGRTLTNAISRDYGIGPDCREALGW